MKNIDDNGTGFVLTVAHSLESLLDKRDFAGAITQFESLRAQVEPTGAEAARVYRLAAKAYAGLGDLKAALKHARLAQAAAEADSDRLLLAEVFMTVGAVLRDMGQFKEAERAFRDAESVFRRNDSPEGQSRALNQLAGLFFRQNDYRNSLTVLMDAVEIARKLNDKKKLAFMMGNIGRICTFTGEFNDAIKHLQINIDLSHELHDPLEAARAELSLAYVYIQQSQFENAEQALERAYPVIVAQNSHRDEICYLTYLGELYYRAGRFDESGDVLAQAVGMARGANAESPTLGRALRHLAELAIRKNDLRSAERHCSAALVIMQKAGDTVEVGALLKIKAQIAASRGKADDARSLFADAFETLDSSGVRWEKADAFAAAGECDVFEYRQRLTYLFRAEEFFARTRNKVRHGEISRTISALEQSEEPSVTRSASRTSDTADYLTANPRLQKFKAQLAAYAKSDLSILLCGETGVGKDRMAKYYHSIVRPDGPFRPINCAAVPETLLESELFGYRKGAFTGADRSKDGLFLQANGGVLFLDEIGDMPLSLQAKLLGVLENRTLTPLGSTEEIPFDVKIVAATNQNLEAMVEAGTFRRDLYYRLSGVSFTIQPLRERKEDIALLTEHFMRRRGVLGDDESVPAELLHQFLSYDWPGNIRELEQRVQRLELMAEMVAEGDLIELGNTLFGGDTASREAAATLFDRVEQFERELLRDALAAAGGNKSEAARLLGIHEATVRTKLKRYNISFDASLPN
ncbi:sigma 54-interacting transcriptional regulator [bacterium]|nr:sigma 54-interacting transcriptional regulator [bacterium]